MRKLMAILLTLALTLGGLTALAEEAVDMRMYRDLADLFIDVEALMAEVPTIESLDVGEKGYGRTYSFDSSFAESARVTFNQEDGSLYAAEFINLGPDGYLFESLRYYPEVEEFQGNHGEIRVYYDSNGRLVSYNYPVSEIFAVQFDGDNTYVGMPARVSDWTDEDLQPWLEKTPEEMQALALELVDVPYAPDEGAMVP